MGEYGADERVADVEAIMQIFDLGDLAGSIVAFGDRGGLLSGRAAGGNCDGGGPPVGTLRDREASRWRLR